MKNFHILLLKQTSLLKALGITFIFITLIGVQSWGQATITWVGTATGSNQYHWDAKQNWNPATNIPTAADDVIIPNTTDKPIITAGAVCRNITINTGGVLTINSGGSLTVSGNWTNDGTFTQNAGTVKFNGNGVTQVVLGNNTFLSLYLDNTNSTTSFGTTTTTVNGTFIKNAGTMDPGTGTFVFTGSSGLISGSGVKYFCNLQISSGAVLTSTATSGTINIVGNYANAGTFTPNVATTINFKSGTIQSLSGAGVTSFGIFNIGSNSTVNSGSHNFSVNGNSFDVGSGSIFNGGTGTVTMNGTTTITGTGSINFNHLTLTAGSGVKTIDAKTAVTVNGTLTTNNLLTINSDATKSGSLILGASGNCSGTVTYNRYFAPTRWYITSAPVNVSSGFGDSNKNKINISSGEYDFAPYQENYVSTDNTDGWKYYKSSPDEFPGLLAPGVGYLISLNNTSTYDNGIIQFKGDLNNGSVSPLLSSHVNGGWNAVGNPYTSAIKITGTHTATVTGTTDNFLDVNLNAGNLEEDYAAIYVWNEDVAGYDETQQFYKAIGNSGYTYTPGTYTGSAIFGPYIQAGQGFLIKLKTDKTSVSFTKAMQVSQPAVTLKSAETSWPGITLLAQSKGQTRSTVVAFNEQMTNGLDVSYDAGLLASDDFQVYTHLLGGGNTVDFAIQCLPDHQYSQLSIPVGVDLPEGGELIFKASGIILPEGMYPILEDKLLGTKTPLKTETDNYTLTLDQNTSGIGRFYLSIGGDMALSTSKVPVNPQYTASIINNRITITGTTETGTKAFLFDINGRKLGEYLLGSLNRNEISVARLNQQVYILKIEGKKSSQVIKLPAIKTNF